MEAAIKKKTKSTTNQNTSATVTPTNPQWVTDSVQNLGGKINETFANLDPYSLVPGADPLQKQAASSAAGLGTFSGYGGGSMPTGAQRAAAGGVDNYARPDPAGASASGPQMGTVGPAGTQDFSNGFQGYTDQPSGPPMMGVGTPPAPQGAPSSGNPYGDAMNTLRDVSTTGAQQGQSASLLDNLQAYMNPYTDQVVNTSLADYNQGAGYTRAENKLALAGDTTFGGSGGAIQTTLSNDAIDRGRGTLAAGLRSDAFNTGAALSAQDAGMRQQMNLANMGARETALGRQAGAAAGLAGVAGAQGADTRANIGAQNDMGGVLRAIEAARAGAPITALGAQQSLLSGLPLDLFKGQNATGSLDSTTKTVQSGMDMGQLLQMAAGAGLMFVPGGQAAGAAMMASGGK